MGRETPRQGATARFWRAARCGKVSASYWQQREEAQRIEDAADRAGVDLDYLGSIRGEDCWYAEVRGHTPAGEPVEVGVEGEGWWVAAEVERWAAEAGLARPSDGFVALHRQARVGERGWN